MVWLGEDQCPSGEFLQVRFKNNKTEVIHDPHGQRYRKKLFSFLKKYFLLTWKIGNVNVMKTSRSDCGSAKWISIALEEIVFP